MLYLVDGKAHEFQVLAHLPHAPLVLLHQTHNDRAPSLAIIRVVVLLVQLYDKLGVLPESIWRRPIEPALLLLLALDATLFTILQTFSKRLVSLRSRYGVIGINLPLQVDCGP